MGRNMTRITFLQLIAGALVSLCLAAVPAGALSPQTYVSGKGTDIGACGTPAAACRSFAFAIAQTAASGTIIAIDPANYGPVNITKSISIVADGGGPAGIFVTTGNAISITNPSNTTTSIVNLRGLTLDGSGTASTGIVYSSNNSNPGDVSVTITDCFIRHFTGDGIVFVGIGNQFLISNTVSSDNQGTGLSIGAAFLNKGVVDHFTAKGNNVGISIANKNGNGTDVMIVDSVMADNASDGLVVGIATVVNGLARLAGSVVTGNGTGVSIDFTSTVFSYGDNDINGNVTDVKGTLTPVAKR
jgi:hypothetical protein